MSDRHYVQDLVQPSRNNDDIYTCQIPNCPDLMKQFKRDDMHSHGLVHFSSKKNPKWAEYIDFALRRRTLATQSTRAREKRLKFEFEFRLKK